MDNQRAGKRLAAILWFVAATLAFIATGIPFFADREPNWSTGAGGLFCLAMGIATLRQSRHLPPVA